MDWYRKRTLGALLESAAERHGERPALVFEDTRWTYSEFNAEVDRVARALIAFGVEPDERVALWMTNRPEWLFLMFAIARVGACIVPLNTRYRSQDVAYTVTQSESATLITLDRSGPIDYQGMLLESMAHVAERDDGTLDIKGFPAIRRLLVLGEARIDHAAEWDSFLAAGESVSAATLAARSAAVDPDAMLMICYTSGTTGHPKGVVHSHRPIRNTMERGAIMGLTAQDVHMNYLPLFHIYAYSEISMMCVHTGACQVLMDVFDAERALDLAEQEGATILHGFEAHWLDLLNAQARRERQLKVRLGTLPSGVESTVPIAEKVQDVFCPTISGFGMSETWAFISVSNPSHTREQRTCSSGYLMNDYEARIVDVETGAEQPVGVPGELWIRGYAVMERYWNKPEATAETLDSDGWLHTGDMAMRREDDMLVFMGRYKDMLKVGGENVSPAEIEVYLRDMDEILDAAVVAYPDPRMAEVPVAFVILNPGATLDAATVTERMRGRVASFKIPRHVLFVDAFPMTSSGKIRKVELRADARRLLDTLAQAV